MDEDESVVNDVWYESCPDCGYTQVIEEKRPYGDNGEEMLRVFVCPSCRFFDWELPKAFEENEDESIFNASNDWAKIESLNILDERKLLHFIEVSSQGKLMLGESAKQVLSKLYELCEILDSPKAKVGKNHFGIVITIDKINPNRDSILDVIGVTNEKD